MKKDCEHDTILMNMKSFPFFSLTIPKILLGYKLHCFSFGQVNLAKGLIIFNCSRANILPT